MANHEHEACAKLATIIVYTHDMHRLAEFYRVGLGIGPYHELPGHLGCEIGKVYFGFDQVDIRQPSTNQSTGTTIWFDVDNLQQTFDNLVGLGAGIVYPPTRKPWGRTLACVRDPDGNILGLAQRVSVGS